jgi:hypothetical protein
VSDGEERPEEEGGLHGLEGVFALVGLTERSFHEHSLEEVDALLDPNLVVHAPVHMEQGAEAFKHTLASTREAFPDMKITIEARAAH